MFDEPLNGSWLIFCPDEKREKLRVLVKAETLESLKIAVKAYEKWEKNCDLHELESTVCYTLWKKVFEGDQPQAVDLLTVFDAIGREIARRWVLGELTESE